MWVGGFVRDVSEFVRGVSGFVRDVGELLRGCGWVVEGVWVCMLAIA